MSKSIYSNRLVPSEFQESMIIISPEPIKKKIKIIYDQLYIQIKVEAQQDTNYAVTIPPGIQDIYGQILNKESKFTFKGKVRVHLVY
jgi:hypothetical protein